MILFARAHLFHLGDQLRLTLGPRGRLAAVLGRRPDVAAGQALDAAGRETSQAATPVPSCEQALANEIGAAGADAAPEGLDDRRRASDDGCAQFLDAVEGLLLEEYLREAHLYALFPAQLLESPRRGRRSGFELFLGGICREGGREGIRFSSRMFLVFCFAVIQYVLLSRGPSFGGIGAEDIGWGRVSCVYG